MRIVVAHSPDPDDAFAFYALVTGKVDSRGHEFVQVYHDIETLNRMCEKKGPDLSAVSLAAFPFVSQDYLLMRVGSSTGLGYGPVVVAKRAMDPQDLSHATVAVPGERTTAFLTARLALGDFQHRVVPFDRIEDAVLEGRVDAGVLIHEGQLTYEGKGLFKVMDLGRWWQEETGLPLVLGVNVIKKSLPRDVIRDVAGCFSESISYALSHRQEALDYAAGFGRGLDRDTLDRFVAMYVNHWTEAMDEKAMAGLKELLKRARERGLVPDFSLDQASFSPT